MFLVRLKPYNKNLGNVKCDYIAPWGAKFVAGIWYEIDDPKAAEYLKTIREVHEDPTSPLAFDVTNKAGARELLAEEKKRKLEDTRPVRAPSVEAPRVVKTTASVELNSPEPTHVLEVESEREGGDDDTFDLSPPDFTSSPDEWNKPKAPKRPAPVRRAPGRRKESGKKSEGEK